MNVTEFSSEFDILYDNIKSKEAPGLNSYEKSVFLTRAQEEIVRKYFSNKENIKQEGDGESIERLIDFSELVIPVELTYVDPTGIQLTDKRSKLYKISDKVYFIPTINVRYTLNTNEYNTNGKLISSAEYNTLMSKIYPEPPRRTTWVILRKDPVESSSETYLEIIPHSKFYSLTSSDIVCTSRYIKKPRPIVLANFESDDDTSGMGLTVEGINTVSQCELNELVHPIILNRAVELAKAVYLGDAGSFVQITKTPV